MAGIASCVAAAKILESTVLSGLSRSADMAYRPAGPSAKGTNQATVAANNLTKAAPGDSAYRIAAPRAKKPETPIR
jgi:hypothetical protein